jgi:hypothetical protein
MNQKLTLLTAIASLSAMCLVAAAVATAAAAAGSVPRKLCTLNVKQQLKTLPVGAACKQSKTAHVGGLSIEGANWGTTDHAIALQVYSGIPKSRFLQQADKTGNKVSLGTGTVGWEDSGATGVGLYAWANGVGLIVLLHQPIGANSHPYLGPVLGFAKAVAKQL